MKKSYFEFFSPVKILAGVHALENIPFELNKLNVKKPLIVTDPGVKAAGLLDKLQAALHEGGLTSVPVFSDVPPDSSMTVVGLAAQAYREQGCDGLLALGGGSAMDTAKGVNMLVSTNTDDLKKLSGAFVLPHPLKPLIAIPTTAGTGSETTLVAVITDPETGQKVPFVSYFLIPNVAVLDPRMTQTLPPQLTAASAMDALTHAIEAFTDLAKNPLSDAYAWSAVELIATHLFETLHNPKDAQRRMQLALAATQAGIAFSNSMVGIVHTLGHSVGAVSHVPHGVAMNIILPHGLEFNLRKAKDDYARALGKLLLPLAGETVYLQTPAEERAARLVLEIRRWKEKLFTLTGLPRFLEETHKVQLDDLDRIVQVAQSDASSIYNPAEISDADAKAVLQAAFNRC